MPDMNGFELQRLLKLRVPQAGILMMTALPEEGLKQKALSAGAHCFLQKPFDVDSLKECLFGLPDLDSGPSQGRFSAIRPLKCPKPPPF